jgi:hypothetical protein
MLGNVKMNRKLATFLAATLLQPWILAMAQQPSAAVAPATAKLEGKVLGLDGKTPVSGAKIIAYHLSTEQLFEALPTGPNGQYEIAALPYGYFDLAVETPEGVFVGNQVVNIPPDGTAGITFTLSPHTDGRPRVFPNSDMTASGTAQVQEKLKGRAFWRSPKGVAIMAGTGGALLLAVAGGDSDTSAPTAASPSTP